MLFLFSSSIFIVVSMTFHESEFQNTKQNWFFGLMNLFSFPIFQRLSLPTAVRKIAAATFLSASMLLYLNIC